MSKRQQKKTPHVQIKELKKKLDTFQLEVEHLLRDVPSIENLCILCNNRDSNGHYDLSCHHTICHSCKKQYKKNTCPICQKNKKDEHHCEKDTSSSDEL